MSNTKFLAAGLAVLVSAFAASTASATPSTLGFYPSTDIYGRGNFHLDVDNYAADDLESDLPSVGLTYGFGNDTSRPLGRNEVGFDYFFGDADNIGDKLTFNIKTQLFDDSDKGVRVVAGGWGLGSTDAAAPNYLYLLGSKTFDFGRVHLGVAHALNDDVVTEDKTSLHVAYDRLLSSRLQFAVDYYTGEGELSGVQPSLYYSINPNASFGLGYFVPNNGGDNSIYLSFDYNFGAPAPEPNPADPGANRPE